MTDTEDDDDDEEEQEILIESGDRIYDISEHDGRYEPIRTSPDDVIQIHTDGENPEAEKR